jgi:recombining binding protein (suppressor of hairless)
VLAKFQYTFFDAFGQNNNIPDMPITPFPTLFTAPVYRQTNNTIELTVANFFYTDPTTGAHTPLDVYLGNLGPLRHRVYQATPPGPLTTISPFINRTGGNVMDNTEPAPASPPSPVAPRFSAGPLHAIVIVEMPALADVIKALEEDALPSSSDDAPSNGRPSPPSDNAQANGLPPPSIAGRSLPLLFIRPIDGVGYHSGRTIACENVFQNLEMGNMGGNPSNAGGNVDTGWLAAAQAAASADGGLHGWTLRVM